MTTTKDYSRTTKHEPPHHDPQAMIQRAIRGTKRTYLPLNWNFTADMFMKTMKEVAENVGQPSKHGGDIHA